MLEAACHSEGQDQDSNGYNWPSWLIHVTGSTRSNNVSSLQGNVVRQFSRQLAIVVLLVLHFSTGVVAILLRSRNATRSISTVSTSCLTFARNLPTD